MATALEAIKLFPANVNVGATLSLAGLGPEKTRVKVVADPDSPGNVHQIYARGSFGVMRFTLENRPHDRNPKTSYLAILSVLGDPAGGLHRRPPHRHLAPARLPGL